MYINLYDKSIRENSLKNIDLGDSANQDTKDAILTLCSVLIHSSNNLGEILQDITTSIDLMTKQLNQIHVSIDKTSNINHNMDTITDSLSSISNSLYGLTGNRHR